MTASSYPLPLLLLLLTLAATSQQASAQALPSKPPRRTCGEQFTQSSCPVPATVQGFDLKAYLGKWYEIGSTARFKLGTESGLACVFANYSLQEQPNSSWGDNITVVNSGLQVLGTVASVGIRQVSEAVSGACAAAKNICSLLAPNSPIEGILDEVKALSAELTGTEANAHASSLKSSIKLIEDTLAYLQAITIAVSEGLSRVSLAAGDVSQGAGSKALKLEQLKSFVGKVQVSTSRLSRVVTSNFRPRTAFISVARSLVATSPARFTGKAFRLMLAYGQIGLQEAAIKVKLAELDLRLNSVVQTADDVILRDNSSPLTYFSLTGFAEHNRGEDPSKLQVRFPLPQGLTRGPYWVVDIVGEASKGYEAALVYSCVTLPGGDLDTGIFILSRTRTLSSSVIDRFIAKAESFGFRFSCDNRFILTVQSHPSCTK